MKQILYTTFIFATMILSVSQLTGQCFDEGHSTFKNQGWLSCNTSIGPIEERGDAHWILYDLGEVYAIDSLKIWNHNVWGETEKGVKEVVIDYSTNQINWNTAGSIEVEKAPGSWKYTGWNGPSLGNADMRYVLITVVSTWDVIEDCAGIAEVRFNIGESVSTEEPQVPKELTIGPNPANEKLNITFSEGQDIQNISIYNAIGQKMKDVQVPTGTQMTITISDLNEGMYFLSVLDEEGMTTRGFVKS